MKFFEWYADESAKPVEIRGLAFDPEVKLRDTDEVKAKNVFIRALPENVTH